MVVTLSHDTCAKMHSCECMRCNRCTGVQYVNGCGENVLLQFTCWLLMESRHRRLCVCSFLYFAFNTVNFGFYAGQNKKSRETFVVVLQTRKT